MTTWTRWFTTKGSVRATAIALAVVPFMAGCTSKQTEGDSSSYLIIQSMSAASGAEASQFSSVLASDVLTFVKKTDESGKTIMVPTIFEDPGQVTFRLALKDPGSAATPTNPTSTNFITVTRYHVEYVRSDGRNTPGVDVPFPFDGGMTVTVAGSNATVGFTLVRLQAKEEAPLRALVGGGGADAITTIAKVTFYGTDQAGRAVSVTGNITVNFADWGDPS